MTKFLLPIKDKDPTVSHAEMEKAVRRDHPEVGWVVNYPVQGEYDVIHVIEAPDLETVEHVAAVLRAKTGGYVEIWPVREEGEENEQDDRVQEASWESFPASDPPSFNP